jgi:hypothetical protein
MRTPLGSLPASYSLDGEAALTAGHRSLAALLGALSLCAAMAAGPAPVAEAQTQIPPDYKGIAGLGLIGAEVGMVLPAVFGMRDAWAYVVFPAVGAIGGGVAGYYLLEANDQTEVSIAMLGVGMALLIPSTLLTLSLSAYDPGDATVSETAAARFDVDAARSRAEQARLRAGGGLVRLSDGGVWLGAPTMGPVASVTGAGRTALRFGVSDFQLALVSGSF